MISKFLARPNDFPLRRTFWKIWYNTFANNFSKKVEIVLMNYGYADLDDSTHSELNLDNHAERYCFQLYHHVTSQIELKGLDVLEVGCGRGGGSSFIKDYWQPKSMSAIDFSEGNIKLCQKQFPNSGVSFQVGDAESLPFESNSFDVIVNVESSHCYGNEERFFSEVARVLRPSGYFLWADFRPQEALSVTQKRLKEAGMKMINDENITLNVIKSMDLEEERKLKSIREQQPPFLPVFLDKWFVFWAKWFVASQGTPMYNAFQTREQEYFCGVWQKSV